MKKKGFTLIELLAVIVILAILAFILIPVIQNLIEDARYASAADSVLNYVHAANTQATVDAGGFEEYKLNLSDTYELETDIDDSELNKIKYTGKGPTYVYMLFSGEDKYVSEGHFCMWGYSIDYNFETGTDKSNLDYCGGEGSEPEGELSCDILNNNAYDSNDVFKIKNIEDLVCISEMSKTKTFENKTIYLLKDIDFNNDFSYLNPNDQTYGDINGNGTIEGLKIELTTEKGFNPIGSSSVPFKGTFEGYANSISNLMINRSQDNVGLIGYNQGKIQGLTISSTITGNSNVGGLVGYNNNGTLNEIIVTSNIDGSNYKGGVVGCSVGGELNSILVKNVVISNGNSNNDTRGGILGGNNTTAAVIIGVVEQGSVGGNYRSSRISGRGNVKSNTNAYASSQLTGAATNSDTGQNGITYALNNDMLNAYDKVLDTYIGGDNDNSGYYFDYENEDSNTIIIKRTAKNPIKFTLKGEGTESDPYIIDNVQRYKEASTLAGKDGNYTIKIIEDLDFTGRHYYALGTNGNALVSDIDGEMHMLSNISFGCAENCGLISQNISNTIEGFNIDNVTITSGNDNVGGLVGYNEGTIKGINATNMNITGSTSVGGLVGYNNNGTLNEIIVTSNIDGSNYKGGVVGCSVGGELNSILVKNVVISNGNSNNDTRGGILGGNNTTAAVIIGVVEQGSVGGNYRSSRISGRGNVKSNTNAYASSQLTGAATNSDTGQNGITYALNNDMLNAYDKVLDTYIGGDNDDSGYYFDYENETSSNIVLKRTKDEPITFTLSGHGTSSDPYIIDSYQHYKEASILASDSYKFKITQDIDFSGKHYYALGTNGNLLGSDIDGDMHTLSNITFGCAENCGLISQNSKTIEGLNLNNITITSGNDNVGGLVGYNEGTVKGINATNMNITGSTSVGGLVGYNNGIVNEVAITSNIDGSNYKGGVVGCSVGGELNSILVKNVVISNGNGNNDTRGGILGGNNTTSTILTGVVEQGSIGGNYYASKVSGQGGIKPTLTAYSSYLISGGDDYNQYGSSGTRYTLVLPTTVTYTVNNVSEEIDSLTYYNNVGVLDTVIGGDDDGSGYYLQYNNSADSIIVVKAGTTTTNNDNPSGTPSTEGVPIEETKVGNNPPTCVLNDVISRSAGIQAVLTCEDEEGAPVIRSQWNVNKYATTNQFSDIGIIKNGTVNGNSKTVRPYWSTSDPISVPTPNTCYYYRFGAQDASGEWSYYVTEKCYYGFGRSND